MEHDEWERKEITFIALGILVFLTNLVEVLLILRKKQRSTFEKLLLSLAFSDLLIGLVITAIKALDFVPKKQLRLKEDAFPIVFNISSLFSMKNLLIIAIDRFLAVRYPIKHRVLVTGRRVNIAIIIIWIAILVIGVGLNIILLTGLNLDRDYFMYLSSIVIIFSGILISFLYICILRVIFTRSARAKEDARGENGTVKQQGTSPVNGSNNTERIVACYSCVVAASFIICTYPFAIEYLKTRSAFAMSFASKLLIFINSLLNPFVYFFKDSRGKSCVTIRHRRRGQPQ